MRISDEYILKSVVDEHIVVPIGDNTVDINCMITLNESGALIWEMIETGKIFEEIVAKFVVEFGITEDVAKTDINEFLDTMKAKGILIDD